ncbi:CAAX protease [Helicobacter cinaedi]|uniref:CAAX protease n=2 Tax=Helicobacter cinaedi TaxID=213 RepID=A0A377JQM7_9HELI|nr:CAAX protease [Helicobacter cinaedi]
MIYNTMQLEDYEFYFSKERMNSYDSVEQHNKNLHLISSISLYIGIFELFFRNKIDSVIRDKTDNEEWLFNLMNSFNLLSFDAMSEIEKNMYQNFRKVNREQAKTHSQIVSRLTFGFWVNLSKLLIFGWEDHGFAKVNYTEILDVSKIDLRKYDINNHILYDNRLKLIFIVRLIQHIRNRAFHWENLLKIKREDNGRHISNISASEKGKTMRILPKNIEIFLSDVLECTDRKIVQEIITPKNLKIIGRNGI